MTGMTSDARDDMTGMIGITRDDEDGDDRDN